MQANEVIETYIGDTARLLPSGQRDDVAAELRSLLNEELHARAQESGRPADESLALSLVRAHGHPNEVAARYLSPWAIIDPADTTSFLRAAVIGAGVVILLGTLSKRMPPAGGASTLIGILTWLGVLVAAFGTKNWLRQCWPALARWQPHDRDRVNRIGAAVVVLLATPVVVLYAAPTWVLGQLFGGRLDTSWAAYTAEFQAWRLPCFIGLLVSLLALLSFAAIQGRWSRVTHRISLGLNMALACLVLVFAVEGNLFQSDKVDRIATDILALVALIYVPCVGVQLYGEIGRIGTSLKPAA